MVTAYIGLGSNLGSSRSILLKGWNMLSNVEGISLLSLSSPYSSEPVGMESENWFINAVGSLETSLAPEELLAEMLRVETRLGRNRGPGSEPEDRLIDLDLLYWNDRVSNDSRVTLPHPEIAGRLFVLQPLAEIAPAHCHPVLKKTSVEMLDDFMAKLQETGSGQQLHRTSWTSEEGEVLK